MTSPLDWNRLVNELEKLQLEWEGKIGQSVEQGPGVDTRCRRRNPHGSQ